MRSSRDVFGKPENCWRDSTLKEGSTMFATLSLPEGWRAVPTPPSLFRRFRVQLLPRHARISRAPRRLVRRDGTVSRLGVWHDSRQCDRVWKGRAGTGRPRNRVCEPCGRARLPRVDCMGAATRRVPRVRRPRFRPEGAARAPAAGSRSRADPQDPGTGAAARVPAFRAPPPITPGAICTRRASGPIDACGPHRGGSEHRAHARRARADGGAHGGTNFPGFLGIAGRQDRWRRIRRAGRDPRTRGGDRHPRAAGSTLGSPTSMRFRCAASGCISSRWTDGRAPRTGEKVSGSPGSIRRCHPSRRSYRRSSACSAHWGCRRSMRCAAAPTMAVLRPCSSTSRSACVSGLRLLQLREPELFARSASRLGAPGECDRGALAGARVLLVGSALEARRAGLTGVHSTAQELQRLRGRPPVKLWLCSCHDEGDLARAIELGADAAVRVSGAARAQRIRSAPRPRLGRPPAPYARARDLPLYAQGGLDGALLDAAQRAGAIGIATARWAVRALLSFEEQFSYCSITNFDFSQVHRTAINF